MKKSLLVLSLLVFGITLSGCQKEDVEFCSLSDDSCINHEAINSYDGEDENDGYPIGEQLCIDNGGSVDYEYDGGLTCFFSNGEICLTSEIEEGICSQIEGYDLYEGDDSIYPVECENEDLIPVCGKDGSTYPNRCYLDFYGIEEDTEAEVTEEGCVFG